MSKAEFAGLKINRERIIKLPKAKGVARAATSSGKKRAWRDQADTLAGWLQQQGIPWITWEEYKKHVAQNTYQLHWAVREYRFAEPDRQWRADFGWPVGLVAEVDGGRWDEGGGRHASDADYEKTNAVCLYGYFRLAFTTSMLKASPQACVETIKAALQRLGAL